MLKKYSNYIAVLLAAGILLAGGNTPAAASVVHYRPYMSPGNAFWPVGNAIGTGKLKLYPELALGVAYNDNIFLEESGEESDLISHVIPRLRIDYSLEERGSIRLGYAGDFAYYQDYSNNDWQRHDLGFLLDYNAPSGIFLDIANDYVNTSDPFGSSDEYALGQQKDRWHNIFGVSLGYDHGDKIKLVGYFNYNKQEYDNTDNDWDQNFEEPWYGVGLEKRLSQKTWGFARYFHGERDYNTDSPDGSVNESTDADYSSDWLEFGLTWDATSRITGELNFGYEWLDYDNTENASGESYNDNDTWLAATRINYSLKPGITNVNINLERGVFQRGSGTSESYDGTYFSVYLVHRFYSWFKLLMNFGIGRNDYNTDRKDDDIRAGISLEYLVWRRFTLALGYDYIDRDSSEQDESFTVNRVMGTLTLRY